MTDEPNTDAPESALPENFKTEGEAIVAGLQTLIEGKPLLTVASALTATLFAAVTSEQLNTEAKEALSIMVYDLGQNVLRENGITEERLTQLMAERSGVIVSAGDQAEEQEQG